MSVFDLWIVCSLSEILNPKSEIVPVAAESQPSLLRARAWVKFLFPFVSITC